MAKMPDRKQKLKVFVTSIGFHDAYVAVPSQKAALEAWGAGANIFAQGLAEQVTDPKLMEEPLANPGKVIKRVRGSTDEHIAELGRANRKAKPKAKATSDESPKPKIKPKPRPSRDELDDAEAAIEKAEKKQRKKMAELDDRIRELEHKRREMQRKYEAERDDLRAKRDCARKSYDRAMSDWRG